MLWWENKIGGVTVCICNSWKYLGKGGFKTSDKVWTPQRNKKFRTCTQTPSWHGNDLRLLRILSYHDPTTLKDSPHKENLTPPGFCFPPDTDLISPLRNWASKGLLLRGVGKKASKTQILYMLLGYANKETIVKCSVSVSSMFLKCFLVCVPSHVEDTKSASCNKKVLEIFQKHFCILHAILLPRQCFLVCVVKTCIETRFLNEGWWPIIMNR